MQFNMTVEGNVAAFPELRYLESGKALCRFRLGHNTRRRNNRGDWVNGPTIWLTVTCWEALAEQVVDSLKPGDTVTVDCRDDLSVFAYINRNTEKAVGELQVTAANVAVSLRFTSAESHRKPKTTEHSDPWDSAYASAYAEVTAEATAATQAAAPQAEPAGQPHATAEAGQPTYEPAAAEVNESAEPDTTTAPGDLVTTPEFDEPADRDPELAAAALIG